MKPVSTSMSDKYCDGWWRLWSWGEGRGWLRVKSPSSSPKQIPKGDNIGIPRTKVVTGGNVGIVDCWREIWSCGCNPNKLSLSWAKSSAQDNSTHVSDCICWGGCGEGLAIGVVLVLRFRGTWFVGVELQWCCRSQIQFGTELVHPQKIRHDGMCCENGGERWEGVSMGILKGCGELLSGLMILLFFAKDKPTCPHNPSQKQPIPYSPTSAPLLSPPQHNIQSTLKYYKQGAQFYPK